MPSSRIQQRIDPRLRHDAETILAAQGIKPSQAISIFYMEVKRYGGLPFLPTPVQPSEIPNAHVWKGIKEARKGIGVQSFRNAEDMFASLASLKKR